MPVVCLAVPHSNIGAFPTTNFLEIPQEILRIAVGTRLSRVSMLRASVWRDCWRFMTRPARPACVHRAKHWLVAQGRWAELTLYCCSRGSATASRSNSPSVTNRIFVSGVDVSSNLTAYPTCKDAGAATHFPSTEGDLMSSVRLLIMKQHGITKGIQIQMMILMIQ